MGEQPNKPTVNITPATQEIDSLSVSGENISKKDSDEHIVALTKVRNLIRNEHTQTSLFLRDVTLNEKEADKRIAEVAGDFQTILDREQVFINSNIVSIGRCLEEACSLNDIVIPDGPVEIKELSNTVGINNFIPKQEVTG